MAGVDSVRFDGNLARVKLTAWWLHGRVSSE